MSDTTKITKARVNGVLYDLGGSGGGTSGVSGAWLAPGELVESGYIDKDSESSWSYMTIDPEALIAQLEKAGIDVDETPFMDSGEYNIEMRIGQYYRPNNGNQYTLIAMNMYTGSMSISILDGDSRNTSVNPRSSSLKQLIYSFFSNVTELYCNVQSSGDFSALANYIEIHYSNANATLRYYIPDMSEFCEEVFVEYTPSSE